jgi:hypothetical protein
MFNQKNELASKAKRGLLRVKDILLRRQNAILAHNVGFWAAPVPSLIVPDLSVCDEDIALAERLLRAYNKATKVVENAASPDVWSAIRHQQENFLAVLEANDPRALASYLAGMNRRDATIGTVQGIHEYNKIIANRRYRAFIALQAKDKLVSLAEALGALPCENPEQGPWSESLNLKTDVLVEKVESELGFKISPPPIDGGLLKIVSSRGLFNERDVNAIYTGWLLKNTCSSASDVSLAEIGAGAGRVAYWSHQYGLGRYTIFDLPHINVLQGFYLQKALPKLRVALYGEIDPGSGIAVRPYFEFFDAAAGSFSLVLNQDSFPEIDAQVVSSYLQKIKTVSSRFLSINHESRPRAHGGERQISVPELISRVGGYRRLTRQLYWLRKGYVVELYDVSGAAT